MPLNLLSQYKFTRTDILVDITKTIDAEFIEEFIREYRLLLKEKLKKGSSFTEDKRTLSFIISNNDFKEDEDFDLLFISYLALIREDFPNIIIYLDFKNFVETPVSNAYLFKLAQHRMHLLISCRKEIFRIFRKGIEFNYEKIVQSTSYIPPIFISQDTIDDLFERKHDDKNYKNELIRFIRENKKEFAEIEQQKESAHAVLQDLYISTIGGTEMWTSKHLSTLYLTKALSELFVLRFLINSTLNKKSEYQIGRTIISSQQDRQSSKFFREGVMSTLDTNGVFNFSDIECYIFSLVVQNSNLFKIPISLPAMYGQVEPLLTEEEKKKAKNYIDSKAAEKYLKSQFIELYISNLRRIINYVKDISYGLQELAKNIVEHSATEKAHGYGMLTARIYSLDKIKTLKNIVPEWLKSYEQRHKFMDINIIDSGMNSVIDSYSKTLEKEISELSRSTSEFKEELVEAYEKDLKQIGNYMLNNLFNFDSIELLHQINRTKARLGLLIFSQTILYEKNAFVSLASNSINIDDTVGFYLYKKGKNIINETNLNFLAVGTNYNFTIPIKEIFEKDVEINLGENDKSGTSSSVYKELHPFANISLLRKLKIKGNYDGLDKYSKIDSLRLECNLVRTSNEILLIDATNMNEILQNSSDWVRFLASLQFTSEFAKDIIIYNFNLDLYLELINILKIFNSIGTEKKGFWKSDRYILFFLPIENQNGDTFWFNSLLCATDYSFFRKVNEDIGLYHENLSKMVIDRDTYPPVNYGLINSSLFSSSKKLLNFELIIKNAKGETLFEETLKSLLNIEINDSVNEN
jgi:hypothetical protein